MTFADALRADVHHHAASIILATLTADVQAIDCDDQATVSAARERVGTATARLFDLAFAAEQAHSLLRRRETLLLSELLDGGA